MNYIYSTSNFMKIARCKLLIIFLLTGGIFSGLFIPNNAYAQANNCTVMNSTTAGVLSSAESAEFAQRIGTIVRDIIAKINVQLSATSAQMYEKIILAPDYIFTIKAAITLFIMVYGILFMTGMVQIKLYDFIINVIKIGFIGWMASPTSWLFFNNTVVQFFNEGTTQLINSFTNTGSLINAVRNVPIAGDFLSSATAGTTAFMAIDSVLSKIISSKMFVILMAASFSNTYGVLMGALIVFSIWLFMQSLMTALWVYIMSLVLKTLLFGLAPIFIPTILFKRTRHLFDNWLNQIVSASLQPILLFVFFIFFVKLMEGSIDQILGHEVCWTKLPEGWRGSGMDFFMWKFAEYKGGLTGWVPNEKENLLRDGFPIPIIQILTFLIIAELANRFNKVAIQIAMQISQASVSLAHEGGAGIGSMFSGGNTNNRKSVLKSSNKPK